MKLTTFLLIIFLSHVSAAALSQQVRLKEKDSKLKDVLKEISSQSGYHIIYGDELLAGTHNVTINLVSSDVERLMKDVLADQPLTFTIKDKTIILQKKPSAEETKSAVQSTLIQGTVSDEQERPLPGATIKVIKRSFVVMSDRNGRFTLNVEPNDTLIVSFVGYQTKKIAVGNGVGRTVVMNISLIPNVSSLNDVVVVGYGTARRKDLTGSVASVNVNEVRDIPYTSIDQALAGKASGVQVVQSDGSPGGVASIRIRGGTSILGGNDPLFIIDGVQVTPQNNYLQNQSEVVDPIARAGADNPNTSVSGSFARGLNSLAGINMNDIESIDILKDASATAIYGSKAANGVVIITTKKGKYDQKPLFEFDNYTGFSKPIAAKLLNADQYRMVLKEAAQNLNTERAAAGQAASPIANSILTDPSFLGNANTNWLDQVLRTGISQNTDISVRGGSKASRYYMSLNYTDQTGVVKGTDFSRLSGKINLDNDITSRIRLMANVNYAYTLNNITNGAYAQALLAPPTRSPYNPDGTLATLTGATLGGANSNGFQNPLALLNGINQGKTDFFQGSMAMEVDIAKGLKFRSQASVSYNTYHQRNYTPSSALMSSSSGDVDTQGGVGGQGQTETTDYLYENTLTYDKYFSRNSHLNILAGTSWQLDKSNSFTAQGQTYPDDFILNDLSSAAITLPSSASQTQSSLLSFYMRGNYDLYDKYLFTVTARSDASSKFGPGNQVGYFPSAGIGWRISQERFLKKLTWLDDLKLRASAGYTGTQNIGDFLYRTLYTPVTYAGANATIPSQLGNNAIKWESTLQKDAGIDISVFKSRLVASVGIYEKRSTGLLFNTNVPTSSGYGSLISNIANINNRGLEIELRGDEIRSKDFTWTTDINMSFNRSLVKKITSTFSDPNLGGGQPQGPLIFSNTVLQQGAPVGLFIGKQFQGIIQNAQQLAAYKVANPYYILDQPYLNIGDPMYKADYSLFGVLPYVNPYLSIGTSQPKFYGGLTNTFTYRNFSLGTLFTYSYGGHILYLADIRNEYVADFTNKGVRILDRWTPSNSNTDRPRLIYGYNSNPGVASNNIYSSSYIKLKSITLNYQFPKPWLNHLGIQTASMYVSATNLFTITKYPGQDPEVSNDPYSLIDGYTDSNLYPTIRQYTLGIRLSF